MNTIVNERELGFTDILNQGLNIFLFKIKDIMLIALCSIVPISIILVFISQEFPSQGLEISLVRSFLLIFLLFLEGIIAIVATMSIAIIAEKVVDHRDITALEAVKSAYSKWGSALTTCLLAALIIAGLTLLFIIPGIIFQIYYIFVLSVVALRDRYGKEALAYSRKLVEGQWWRVFGIVLGLGIIIGLLNVLFTYVLSHISANPYFSIIPAAISYSLDTIFSLMVVVLFLNNDFVYNRRLVKRKEAENLRKLKSAPSVEQLRQTLAKDTTRSAKRTPAKKSTLKPVKKTTAVKKAPVKRNGRSKK